MAKLKANMPDKEERFVRVTMHVENDGVIAYLDAAGVVLAYKLPQTGAVADIRPNPPLLAMSPCPYCGAENDRGHNLLHHADPFLGQMWIEGMG